MFKFFTETIPLILTFVLGYFLYTLNGMQFWIVFLGYAALCLIIPLFFWFVDRISGHGSWETRFVSSIVFQLYLGALLVGGMGALMVWGVVNLIEIF